MDDIEEVIDHYETQNDYCEGKEGYQEELRCNTLAIEALEKQVQEDPILSPELSYLCPECGASIQVKQEINGIQYKADKFCRNCGQALIEVQQK